MRLIKTWFEKIKGECVEMAVAAKFVWVVGRTPILSFGVCCSEVLKSYIYLGRDEMRKNQLAWVATFGAMLTLPVMANAETEVITLGTGTPVPNGERAGAGIAVIHDGEAYLFDVGAGVTQRAIQAYEKYDIDALYPPNIDHVFLTHLHSDHIVDFPELLASYWWRRESPINLFGPVGSQSMSEGVYQFLELDMETRLKDKSPVINPDAAQANVTEFEGAGVIYDKNDLRVEALPVTHGDWDSAYGYKVTTPDKTIVISGDTSANSDVAKQASGADILLHEAISHEGWSGLSEKWQAYHQYAHTLTTELADIATEANPNLLVLYHVAHYGAPIEGVVGEVKAGYDGDVVLADDLDIFK
ncbi:MBL fold metallo-hydrolase [Chromohalobacter israelensis]|uniref:MBL fold metallo-hydrolase n=1 Tax=Chromohalobacter israelensis TaxID=141390 RepID=UPI00265C3528|nr:MBL fold metallo-hydrolase [Chromohalobacter salexigens]MDO0945269.1 MBL fold metallo-hydrolase [Chromohalobacter salexigens]